MRSLILIAAVAGLATAANATPTRHHKATDTSQNAAVKALNEQSLQQASAGQPMTTPGSAPAMSDSGAAAPARSDNTPDTGMSTPAQSPDTTPASPTTDTPAAPPQ